MATGSIEVPLGSPPGTISSFVHDNNNQPASVLEATLPFLMHVEWQIDQALADILGPGPFWRLEVYADQLGGPFDGLVGTLTVNHVAGQRTYGPEHVTCNTPPFTVDSPGPGQSNLYKLAVVLTYANGAAEHITGFTEEITVRFI
jgi:hypothetical protein